MNKCFDHLFGHKLETRKLHEWLNNRALVAPSTESLFESEILPDLHRDFEFVFVIVSTKKYCCIKNQIYTCVHFRNACLCRTQNLRINIPSLDQLGYSYNIWSLQIGDIKKVYKILDLGEFYYSRNEWNWTNTCNLCFHRICPLKSIDENFQNVFQYFRSIWILLVPKHSLLKYFKMTFTRQKSSKFEVSGTPLSTRPRDRVQTGELLRYKSWTSFPW